MHLNIFCRRVAVILVTFSRGLNLHFESRRTSSNTSSQSLSARIQIAAFGDTWFPLESDAGHRAVRGEVSVGHKWRFSKISTSFELGFLSHFLFDLQRLSDAQRGGNL